MKESHYKLNKFSIVISFWNIDFKWLDRCIESILSTSYKKIEIIFVDDGSNNSKEINQEIINKIKKQKIEYKLIKIEHKGNAKAKKIGIQNISNDTDYVWFVDADDYIYSKSFYYLNKFLSKNDADILNFKAKTYYCENNNFSHFFTSANDIEKRVWDEYFIESSNPHIKGVSWFDPTNIDWSNCLQVYKKEFIKKMEFSFYDGNEKYEDIFNFILLNSFATKIGSINKELYIYWKNRNNSITNQNKFNYEYIKSLINIINESFYKIDYFYLKKNYEFNIEIFNMIIEMILVKNFNWLKIESFSKNEKKKLLKKIKCLLDYKYINNPVKENIYNKCSNLLMSDFSKIIKLFKKAIIMLFKNPYDFFRTLLRFIKNVAKSGF